MFYIMRYFINKLNKYGSFNSTVSEMSFNDRHWNFGYKKTNFQSNLDGNWSKFMNNIGNHLKQLRKQRAEINEDHKHINGVIDFTHKKSTQLLSYNSLKSVCLSFLRCHHLKRNQKNKCNGRSRNYYHKWQEKESI